LEVPYHAVKREVRLCDETVYYNTDKAIGVFQGRSAKSIISVNANKHERPAISLQRGITCVKQVEY
jgi:hypothetical protein